MWFTIITIILNNNHYKCIKFDSSCCRLASPISSRLGIIYNRIDPHFFSLSLFLLPSTHNTTTRRWHFDSNFDSFLTLFKYWQLFKLMNSIYIMWSCQFFFSSIFKGVNNSLSLPEYIISNFYTRNSNICRKKMVNFEYPRFQDHKERDFVIISY